MPDRVWKIYKKYSYYSEFFDMVWLRHRLWPTIKNQENFRDFRDIIIYFISCAGPQLFPLNFS